MTICPRWCVAAEQVIRQVAAEADPGEEQEKAGDEEGGSPPVGFLLRKEVLATHASGYLLDRSTVGTARSESSSISHNSAGDALAMPAIMLVGNMACLVL